MKKTWKTLPKDEFMELAAKYPAKTLAEMFGVTFGAVYYRIRTYGTKLRGHKDPRRPTGPTRSFQPPKNELAELLKRMSMRDVAEHYGVGETVVFTRVKQYGLQGPSRSERLKAYASNRTPEHNAKIATSLAKRTGELATGWRGGRSTEERSARTRVEYRVWKQAVISRDAFKCARCGVEQGHLCECCGARVLLHAHHVKPFSEFPDLRYEVSNGISLCGLCHWQEHHSKPGELLGNPKSRAAKTKPVTASGKA